MTEKQTKFLNFVFRKLKETSRFQTEAEVFFTAGDKYLQNDISWYELLIAYESVKNTLKVIYGSSAEGVSQFREADFYLQGVLGEFATEKDKQNEDKEL